MTQISNNSLYTNISPIGAHRITGYDLKMIALITMLIDHVGAALLWRYIEAIGGYQDEILVTIYQLMRYVGRMAFPIYCFLLVEGFLHTRSVGKYALRLGIFALISEVPFDLALNKKVWDMSSNNVFFTLLIGLLLIWGISFVEKFFAFWREKELDIFIGGLATFTVGILMIAPALYVAESVLNTDYGMGGVLAILLLYLFRSNRYLAYGLAIIALYILSSSSEILALLMLYPLSMYDGTRGQNTKYMFYAFYPAHLLILGLLCMVLGI